MRNFGEVQKFADAHEKLSTQGAVRWGQMAALDLYQLDIIPFDHHGSEEWILDNGLDGVPGMMAGDLRGPSNFGVLNIEGKEYCIVRDMEHVYSRAEILANTNYKRVLVQ